MKILSVEAFPVRLARDRDQSQRTAGSPTGLQEGTGAYRWSSVFPALYSIHFETALIKITTREGFIGWGEAQAPLAPEVACAIVERLLDPVLRGAEFSGAPAEIETLWERMYATMRVRGQTGGFMLDAISGVDIALWDLAGKARGLPVAKLLSETPRPEVPAYLSGVSGSSTADRVATAARRWAEGFRLFKLFHESTPGQLLETFDALRDALGAEADIAVDALWRFEPDAAAAFGAELDRRNAFWLEAPLAPEDAIRHGQLARRIRTPLALGESYRTRFEMAPFFRENAVAFAQPDLGRTGITEGRRIAADGARNGAVVPHLSIALAPQIAAAIHFAAATPACPFLEFNPNVLAVANRYVESPLEIRGARYQVPAAPGLGVNILEAQLRRDAI